MEILQRYNGDLDTGGSHLFFCRGGKGVVEIVAQETKVSLLKTDLL